MSSLKFEIEGGGDKEKKGWGGGAGGFECNPFVNSARMALRIRISV